MDVKPFLHKHYLLFDEYENQEAFCDKCNQKIGRWAWAFTCELCKFWLHQSCAKQKLPPMISHPLHSELLLQNTDFKDFVCDKCFTLARGFKYSNKDHSFNLDVICASSINDQTVKKESERFKDMGKKIPHFCHRDSLTLFNYRKVRWYEYCCSWCEKPLSGMSYGCVRCSPPFFLHQFCLHMIPNKIIEHPFHPSHPLYITNIPTSIVSSSYLHCATCDDAIISQFCYSCRECSFHFHVLWAKLKPTLKHKFHNHDLTYVTEGFFKCQKCETYGGSQFYRCVQCNFNFHFDCLIRVTVTHKYHTHSLTVVPLFKEDGLGEYYCDICEEQRNPEHPVYCCKECMYVAHIECGLGNKVVDAKLQSWPTSSIKHKEIQQNDLDFPTDGKGLKIKHFDHKHPLIFKEVKEVIEKNVSEADPIFKEIEKTLKLICQACEVEVCNQAYVCQEKICRYYLHKKCAELSDEVLHPLHYHPLLLISNLSPFSSEKREVFICDNCREVSSGFMYCCFGCNFKLDIKCIVGTASNIVKQGPNGIERPTNLFHFIHSHELLLFNCMPNFKRLFSCDACSLEISGPAYCCLECNLFVHESCLRKLPREIQIQSHPQHNLLPNTKVRIFEKVCLTCKSDYPSFWYNCLQCDIYIHFYCAGSLLQRPLSSKSHSHNLYLFSRNKRRLLSEHLSSKCGKCNKRLGYRSVYHCIQCDINFHLQCVEIFYRVKCKHHIHPLILKECFAEDDSGEYYCDVCEENRDPENDVYYCKECDGRFTAHIECVAAEVEEVLRWYGPDPYSPPETWY